MRFKITSAGNNSTFGDVFFSVPTKEEMQKAEKRVAENLSSYNTPECVSKYFSNVRHLWEPHACISRFVLMCAIAWYQINYPTEFMTLENGEL